MFNFKLPWFPKWNDENPIEPKDYYKPIFIFGSAMGAVVVAAVVIAYGHPAPVTSTQTGPAGTAMATIKFKSDAEAPDPTLAAYASSDPVVPSEGAVLAKDAIENFEPLLGDLTVENYNRLVSAMREWTGIPDLLEDPESYQTVVARRMIQMVQSINENWGGHVAPTGVNCYTCHRGEVVPSGVWFRTTPVHERAAEGWAAVQNRVTPVSQYTSLPSDALEEYLVNYGVIAVHDLDSRVDTQPGDPTWQDTERTYSLMNYFSNSLNVNCVFCHNSRAFYDPGQNTPQWALAQLAIAMVLELNNEYLIPLKDSYPPERLGPLHADAPKAACRTCHKGYSKPMGGADMISDWPELATTEAPVYAE